MHDFAAWIEGKVSGSLQSATERARLLGLGIAAYRPGLAGPQLIAAMLCCIEDAQEYGRQLMGGMEDFEKFFDACATEIILMAMRASGFGRHGYVQWAGESLRDRHMFILTVPRSNGIGAERVRVPTR